MEFIYISALSFLFGFFQKIADGHNEHGLNWFPYAGILFGVIWGGIGYYLVGYNQVITSIYLAIVLYWIYKLKVDHTNHAISVLMILFGVFLSHNSIDTGSVVYLLLSYILIDIVKHKFDLERSYFFRYRLQFILIPIIYSVIIQDIFGSVIIFNLLGISLANKIFRIK
ncbi:TPA: hypothetical protein DCZ36_01635 [Candidatus Gracilibacteria bacterium]|nr:hypothetical protein [Candidatus Gracilibacteria bacterium]